jgi:predicted component of type VI protein secretion system
LPQRTIIRTVITKVEALAREVEKLTAEELEALRRWLAEYDWQAWDREIEQDAAARKLDQFAAEALAEFERGETKDI